MWQKFLALPGLRAADSSRVTTIQLPTGLEERAGWGPGERRAELRAWATALSDPVARAAIEQAVLLGMNVEGASLWARWHAMTDVADRLQSEVDALRHQVTAIEEERRRLAAEAVDASARIAQLARDHEFRTAELAAVRGSLTWRTRDRLLRNSLVRRGARRLLARRG
jgi:hypothetical protein